MQSRMHACAWTCMHAGLRKQTMNACLCMSNHEHPSCNDAQVPLTQSGCPTVVQLTIHPYLQQTTCFCGRHTCFHRASATRFILNVSPGTTSSNSPQPGTAQFIQQRKHVTCARDHKYQRPLSNKDTGTQETAAYTQQLL